MNPNARDTDLMHLHPVFRERVSEVLNKLENEEIPFRLFEGCRSPDRQHYLFSQGRTRPGDKVTNADAWQSLHQYGVAGDFVLFINGNWSWNDKGPAAAWWKRLHEIGKHCGLEPLSFEKPHMQLAGLRLNDLRRGLYPSGGDSSWAEHLEAMIIPWRGLIAAPPIPPEAGLRPALEVAV